MSSTRKTDYGPIVYFMSMFGITLVLFLIANYFAGFLFDPLLSPVEYHWTLLVLTLMFSFPIGVILTTARLIKSTG